MKIHRAWIVAGATFLVLICAAAFRSTTSVLYMPLEMEFGWTRSITSGAVGLNILVYGLTAPLAAVLMGKFGTKLVALIALVFISAGTGLTVVMTQAWQLYLYWGILVGIGTGCLALVFGAAVANTWFTKRRGLITGIFSAAYATGQLLFLPNIAALSEAQGWRMASLVVAGFAILLIPIIGFAFANSPASVGTEPYGGATEESSAKPPVTLKANWLALKSALGKSAFWLLAGTFFVCGWTTNGLIGAHFIPAAHDHGMPTTMAAGLLAVVGIFDFIGTIASGWLTDRFNPAYLLVSYYGLRGLALFTVPFVLGPNVEPPLFFFIVFYGLDWIATVPPTVELCRKHFGLQNSPLIYGWVFASHMIGAAIASGFAGWIREFQGDYFIAWIVAAVLCLAAAVASLWLRGRKS
ncbi:MAG: MFS transporter [Micrococcales bacterium]